MNRTVVLAHFDPDGTVDEYVIEALHVYRQVSSRLVMVSASTREPPATVRRLVDTFIARDNEGYDFCSWREGIESIGSLEGIDELICVNDSVYGPTRDLAPVLNDPRVANADAWGMCLSTQGVATQDHAPTAHLQSWFVAMRRPVIRSEAFRAFWGSVEPLPTKTDVIDRYEVGLSERLTEAGFRIAGIHDARIAPPISWEELAPMVSVMSPRRSLRLLRRARRGSHRHNPAELRPVRLLLDGVPFIKASVFRVNHYRLDLDYVARQLESITGFGMDTIRSHQLRIARRDICGHAA